ncbi:hypothetical protein BC826DRAFT_1004974 [Russula brevipes]|nr:hypothetical protein BC826DRAFT_1004974 [Russula brevipes]
MPNLMTLSFLYFSGHGTQVKDMNGGGQGGIDECICAVDWRGNGQPPYEDTPGLIIDGRSCTICW